ncbi:hypothetical protein ACFLVS_01080 [Chloroflexota bacterium]
MKRPIWGIKGLHYRMIGVIATTLIKNDYLLDPYLPFEKRDILIEDDLITQVASNIDFRADTIINTSDKVILPGLIHAHTHTFGLPIRGLTGNLPLDGSGTLVAKHNAPSGP